MADLLVYEMPQNLADLTSAVNYWKGIVDQTKGKSKETLIREAMTRANLSLPNQKLESISNIDTIAAQMPTLVQNTPVLAANLHRVAERTIHSRIPQSRVNPKRYVGQFEKWWETNKSLYQPKQIVTNSDYDRYHSSFSLRGMSAEAQDDNDDDTNAPAATPAVKSKTAVPPAKAIVPKKPAQIPKAPVTKPNAKKGKSNAENPVKPKFLGK